MTIHKEGRRLLLFMGLILVAINFIIRSYFAWAPEGELILLTVSVVLFILVLQFFRSPKITTALNESYIYAPADGKVVVIEETREEEYFEEAKRQISIFMSPVNVHINRSPVSGVITYFKYHAGKYLVAWHPKSSSENERTTLVVKTKQGIDILIRQIAGAMARRIKYYVNSGDTLQQGEEFGFIKFGSRVDVFLPLTAEVLVQVGQKTRAGRTVLAKLKE